MLGGVSGNFQLWLCLTTTLQDRLKVNSGRWRQSGSSHVTLLFMFAVHVSRHTELYQDLTAKLCAS